MSPACVTFRLLGIFLSEGLQEQQTIISMQSTRIREKASLNMWDFLQSTLRRPKSTGPGNAAHHNAHVHSFGLSLVTVVTNENVLSKHRQGPKQ